MVAEDTGFFTGIYGSIQDIGSKVSNTITAFFEKESKKESKKEINNKDELISEASIAITRLEVVLLDIRERYSKEIKTRLLKDAVKGLEGAEIRFKKVGWDYISTETKVVEVRAKIFLRKMDKMNKEDLKLEVDKFLVGMRELKSLVHKKMLVINKNNLIFQANRSYTRLKEALLKIRDKYPKDVKLVFLNNAVKEMADAERKFSDAGWERVSKKASITKEGARTFIRNMNKMNKEEMKVEIDKLLVKVKELETLVNKNINEEGLFRD